MSAAATPIQTRIYQRVAGWLARLYDHPYNRAHPATALARLARYYALKRGGRPKTFRFWGTRTVRCYPESDGSMWLILNVIMDWNEFHFMQRFLRPTDVFLDVGANVGTYTLWATQFVGTEGRVVAFEPDPKNLLRLREQLELNRLERVEIAPLALAEKSGRVRFSQGQDMVNHIVTEAAGAAFIEVPANTLDAFCAEHEIERVNFLKIDVEGAEQLVLGGAQNLLRAHAIDVLQLEFNEQVIARGLEESGSEKLLRNHGYRLYRFDVPTSQLTEASVDSSKHENLFAIHDIESVRRRLLSGS